MEDDPDEGDMPDPSEEDGDPPPSAAENRAATRQAAHYALGELARLSPGVLHGAGELVSAHGTALFLAALDADEDGALSFNDLLNAEALAERIRNIAAGLPVEHDAADEIDGAAVLEVYEAYLAVLADRTGGHAMEEMDGEEDCGECAVVAVPIDEMEGDVVGYLHALAEEVE